MTAPDMVMAKSLAREFVDARCAACVNLVPGVQSVYRWKGAVEEAGEVLMIAKTTAERVDDLMRLLRERHPYELPECVVVAPRDVEARYKAWIADETAR